MPKTETPIQGIKRELRKGLYFALEPPTASRMAVRVKDLANVLDSHDKLEEQLQAAMKVVQLGAYVAHAAPVAEYWKALAKLRRDHPELTLEVSNGPDDDDDVQKR